MHYVILRDDDTNGCTPAVCLETLYRPFLKRGLPVNLAVIPDVHTGVKLPDGRPEGFLAFAGTRDGSAPLTQAGELTAYLRQNPGFGVVQHGCHHDPLEFDCAEPAEVVRRIEQGRAALEQAGFGGTRTFVAPYDQLSRVSLREVSRRYQVLSTGWFELRRLPIHWWPNYVLKKMRGHRHWQVGRTLLLTHPGCLLSCFRDYSTMLEQVKQTVQAQRLTVLVTHWWEYFRGGRPDEAFIGVLHELAEWLASNREVRVISFDSLPGSGWPLN